VPAHESSIAINPAPTSEEAVAIVAATEALWPKPMMADHADRDRTLAWRFSGRWWQRDRFAKSDRPWS
jgi:hypothetical protein